MANEDLQIYIKDDLSSQVFSDIMDRIMRELLMDIAQKGIDPAQLTEVRAPPKIQPNSL